MIVLSFSLLIACAKTDKSILVKEGDDLLDCRALANEFEFAKKTLVKMHHHAAH